jgi:hypothetical protein
MQHVINSNLINNSINTISNADLNKLQNDWVQLLNENISTINPSNLNTNEYDLKAKGKLNAPALPKPKDSSSPNSNSKEAYITFAALINLLESLQSQSSEKMSESMASLSVSQAKFGAAAAQSTYDADMDQAKGMLIQGIMSIVGGGLSILGGLAGGVMDAITPAAEEGTEAAVNLENSAVKEGEGGLSGLAKDEDAAGAGSVKEEDADEGEEGIGEKSTEESQQVSNLRQKEDVNSEASDQIQSKQAEQEQEIEGIAKKAESGGADAEKANDGDPKPKGRWANFRKWTGTSSAWKNTAKMFSGANMTVSPLFSGIGGTLGGQYQESAAPAKKLAGYDQVVQGLAQSAYQATQSTVGNTDKEVEALLQAGREYKQMNAAVTRG